LVEAYKQGKIKAIGVSNFVPDRLADLVLFNEVVPTVNQIEAHVFWQRKEDTKIADKFGIKVQSWGPFVEGKNNFFANETLLKIGKKYNKTVAQVGLRFLLQNGMILIPKSTHKERMQENFDIFGFELSKDDMSEIEKLDLNKPMVMPCLHNSVEAVEFMANRKI